jgi:hypothetical protein
VTDSTDESTDQSKRKYRDTWQQIPGVDTGTTPVPHWFDPPLEHRPYDEIVQEINEAMKMIQKRRYSRRKVT